MALQDYIITLEEGEMTPELRALLESKGATIREAPLETIHLPPEEEKAFLSDLEAFRKGDLSTFTPWEDLREELEARRAKRREDG